MRMLLLLMVAGLTLLYATFATHLQDNTRAALIIVSLVCDVLAFICYEEDR